MNSSILPLLCDPDSHERLEFKSEALINPKSGKHYPVRDGIPIFLDQVFGQNKKYQELYERIAIFYDVADRIYRWLKRKDYYRYGYLEELEVAPGARVLEVSIGTGANIPLIRSDVEFFGLDLTWAMLRRCSQNLRKWKRSAELFQGEAERLPFIDSAFDVVFHVGGINFFNDKARAIREMIRVAKPGTKIIIADETEKTVKESYAKTPIVKEYFEKGTGQVAAPLDLIPSNMLEVRSKDLAHGRLYCITFRTPRNA